MKKMDLASPVSRLGFLGWSAIAALCLAACTATGPTAVDADAGLRAAVASPQRNPANSARDPARHPYDTLHAFGLRPDWAVIEVAPGGGWYTEILAPYLRDGGHYVAALYVEGDPTTAVAGQQLVEARRNFETKFGSQPDRYGRIGIGMLGPAGLSGVGGPASADAVLTFRNIHNWISDGHFDNALQAFFTVLKPGGVLGVEEHRALPGTPLDRIIATGYVPEAFVIEHARAAGFELQSRSEANANPRDDTQHPNGVWSLPPTLRGGVEGRDSFRAIGESDRMTLTFVKPRR